MYIGSVVITDANGKPALQHTVGTNYNSAHATASTNDQADSIAASQAQTTGSSTIEFVSTVQGDAATYWSDGKCPGLG